MDNETSNGICTDCVKQIQSSITGRQYGTSIPGGLYFDIPSGKERADQVWYVRAKCNRGAHSGRTWTPNIEIRYKYRMDKYRPITNHF